MAEDNTWYIAISEGFGRYFSIVAAGSKFYSGFAKCLNSAGGSKIIAEQFGVPLEVVDKITGFDESGKKQRKIL